MPAVLFNLPCSVGLLVLSEVTAMLLNLPELVSECTFWRCFSTCPGELRHNPNSSYSHVSVPVQHKTTLLRWHGGPSPQTVVLGPRHRRQWPEQCTLITHLQEGPGTSAACRYVEFALQIHPSPEGHQFPRSTPTPNPQT